MTFSTRSNPRLGQSPPALTSLGAVGGARGVSAGALRVFVEFLSTYDRGATDQLENDLRQIDHQANNSAIAEEKRQARLTRVRKSLGEAELIIRGKLDTAHRGELKKIEALESSRSTANRNQAKRDRILFAGTAKSLGLTDKEIGLISQKGKLLKEEEVLVKRSTAADIGQTRRAHDRLQVENQIGKIQKVRESLIPKLQGLAIGAVGGIIGGAVLGLGFQLAQTAIEKLGDVIHDIIDPARHARDAIGELGKVVNDLADQKKITQLQAASEIVASFGVPKGEADRLAAALAQVAAMQKVVDVLKLQAQASDFAAHSDQLRAEQLKEVTKRVREAAIDAGTYSEKLVRIISTGRGAARITEEYVNGIKIEEVALERLNLLLAINADQAAKAEAATRALAAAQSLASFAADKFSGALQGLISSRSDAAQAQIAGLSDEPSARTKSLEDALERAQGGGAGATLRNLAEERALILLRQRLKLLGTNIDLEKFSGKFLLEAINVKIGALQKEGDAQDRLNKLLDLQYEQSKIIRRQTGESIADFVERRAKEHRDQLKQAADLERQAAIAKLEDQRDKVQDEVALAENAEAAKNAAAKAGESERVKLLKKQLKESKKADAEALEAQKKAIQDKLKAEEKAAQTAIKVTEDKYQAEFKAALSAVKSIENLFSLSAEVQGLKSAQAFLRAFGSSLVASGVLTQRELDSGLLKISSALSSFDSRRQQILTGHPGSGGPREFQHGGVMMLNNARSPFGQNVKLGEGGSEIGVILSNKVAAILKNNGSGVEQVGPFNLYGSIDPLGDTYRFKRLVKEAVSEALR